ncbi:HD domain-containing protein [Hahella sp. KA22]|uniref:HD domain-containing protein n=1 Tax=Hahella sp. KA22 TaxID=1628392 RepID=UPI000FDD901F|nr:HD domain-containing protein [Hahella sp. KA22]AZZ95305.1 HD domain-containing protein [Hahella sp. KA22]QAY52950.1 HD domain-containing protein [Hahella sp. KA22]
MFAALNTHAFQRDYAQLANVTLNPERHTADNALVHCEMVASRALQLADLNGCTETEKNILEALARVHDIGKINGSANPEESLKNLALYGEFEERFVNLVKYHDINLPWYISKTKGQPPSDKAWRKMASKVDMQLLCLFMIADRVDCPGGWTANKALTWFLQEAAERGYYSPALMHY